MPIPVVAIGHRFYPDELELRARPSQIWHFGSSWQIALIDRASPS